jgi:hypothetical protein
MYQSSYDCIFARLLTTPNNKPKNKQGRSRTGLHGRDASCTIDEQGKSVSVTGAGLFSGSATSAGRAAAS